MQCWTLLLCLPNQASHIQRPCISNSDNGGVDGFPFAEKRRHLRKDLNEAEQSTHLTRHDIVQVTRCCAERFCCAYIAPCNQLRSIDRRAMQLSPRKTFSSRLITTRERSCLQTARTQYICCIQTGKGQHVRCSQAACSSSDRCGNLLVYSVLGVQPIWECKTLLLLCRTRTVPYG